MERIAYPRCMLTIVAPKGNVSDASEIRGLGTPYACIYIGIDAFPILCACVEESGEWRAENPYPMEEGQHSVTVSLYAYPCCQLCAKEAFAVSGGSIAPGC